MSSRQDAGMLGIFTELDAATTAIERLRKAGMRDMVVFSPMPRHEIEHAVGTPESPVRVFTLVGALTTILGLFITARLPRMRGNVVYDPSFSVGRFGVFVVPPAGREGEARNALNESGAVELRERPEEVRVGTT